MKKLALFLCLALLLTGFTGCSLGKTGITALQLPQIPTLEDMDAYIAEHGYVNDLTTDRLHHEIYLSDARKVAPDKWKTVLRHPIRPAH